MGIRFACNLCERSLNIKRELAGKIGVCPHCGGRIRIPHEDATRSPSVRLASQPLLASPLDEPGAQWYVRPPAGGQYGPASGEILRTWIAENRVTASTLIWRDGWPQWRTARETLPELAEPTRGKPSDTNGASIHDTLDDPLLTNPQPSALSSTGDRISDSTSLQPRSNPNRQRILLIVALTVVSVILIVTLIYLAMRS
jgi:hypothetical protein